MRVLNQDFHALCDDLNQIEQTKKSLTFGERPVLFCHVLASARHLADTVNHGFATPLTQLRDPKNWCSASAPRISVHSSCDADGFVIRCWPIGDDGRLVKHALLGGDDLGTGFAWWDPTTMSPLVQVPKLSAFIRHTMVRGDLADKALMVYLHNRTVDLLKTLYREFQVGQFAGPTIQGIARRMRDGEVVSPCRSDRFARRQRIQTVLRELRRA